MRILSPDEFNKEKSELIDEIISGAVFIYPTDTIYGIGCNATNSKAVKKIRKIKNRAANPFSVIAPSKEWISENCTISKEAEKWIKKLPGTYTFILKLKNNRAVSKEVNPDIDTLGVRIPDHWISELASEANTPIVTTSVNKSSEDFMTSLNDLDASIKSSVDFIIYEGKKKGKPSTIVNLTEEIKIIKRK
ncbi:MAG TPA: L-threonylcarbamoyladenylate synthase [Candidatus Nanoarchaeia archaeon]|nr:L-threonylcarbamoyladenylate synthase [Candidatus Nanoarchaeia archaeon]